MTHNSGLGPIKEYCCIAIIHLDLGRNYNFEHNSQRRMNEIHYVMKFNSIIHINSLNFVFRFVSKHVFLCAFEWHIFVRCQWSRRISEFSSINVAFTSRELYLFISVFTYSHDFWYTLCIRQFTCAAVLFNIDSRVLSFQLVDAMHTAPRWVHCEIEMLRCRFCWIHILCDVLCKSLHVLWEDLSRLKKWVFGKQMFLVWFVSCFHARRICVQAECADVFACAMERNPRGKNDTKCHRNYTSSHTHSLIREGFFPPSRWRWWWRMETNRQKAKNE